MIFLVLKVKMGGKQVSSSVAVLALITLLLVVSVSAKIPDSTLKKIQRVNSRGPYLALLTVYPPEEAAFNASKIFKEDEKSHVDLSGNYANIILYLQEY